MAAFPNSIFDFTDAYEYNGRVYGVISVAYYNNTTEIYTVSKGFFGSVKLTVQIIVSNNGWGNNGNITEDRYKFNSYDAMASSFPMFRYL